MNRIFIAPDEFRQYVDVSVRVSVSHVYVQLIANRSVPTFYDRALDIRISTNLKLMPSIFNIAWNVLFKSSLPLSVRTQTGRLLTGFKYFASIDRNAELTDVPVFDRSGTIFRYFEKVSITLNRYLYFSLYLLRDCISIMSHPQTSITFVTVNVFLGNQVRTGRCNVYESCFKSHDLILCLDFDFVAAASFCTVENAEGREDE